MRNYGHRHSVSSSSASSTAWSIATDEDEDDPNYGIGSDYSYQDSSDALHDAHSKSPSFLLSKNNRLSYARRPSGTNNRSTVPHLHRRTSSGSVSGHVHSAPGTSTEDEDNPSDSGFEDDAYWSVTGQSAPDRPSTMLYDRNENTNHANTITSKTKRTRNRASLPTYFSLLQMPSSPQAASSSSIRTTALVRPSPPTPRLSLAGLSARPFSVTAPPTANIQATPRLGKRRDMAEAIEAHTRQSGEAQSRSSSKTRERQTTLTNKLRPALYDPSPLARSPLSTKNSAEQVFDWSSVPPQSPARGRAAVRRNSSPPPKLMRSLLELGLGYERSVSPPSRNTTSLGNKRGRMRVDELDGVGGTVNAPGFGHGRSGLLDREKRRAGKFFRS